MSTIQPLSQQDPRWKDKNLGQNQITIGKFDCLLACLAMVANGYGADETPASLNDKMVAAGGFIGALVRPSVMPRAVPQVRFIKYIPWQPERNHPGCRVVRRHRRHPNPYHAPPHAQSH